MQNDTQRRRDAAARKAALEAEIARAAAHQQHIQGRRKELLEQLPEEPTGESNAVVVVALRFADGTAGQRRFLKDETQLQTLFDWADAMYAKERETVRLQTLNGSHTFHYETDKEFLLSSLNKKMVAFRVTEATPQQEKEDTPSDEL